MVALVRTEPDRFSANVAMRCIVQQRLFPVAAYVAGPGEVAYWAQFKELFDRYELPMPIVYPRARAVLTTLKLTQLTRKLGLTLDDFGETPEALIDRSLDNTDAHPAPRPAPCRRPVRPRTRPSSAG